jgi:hypothetical protein
MAAHWPRKAEHDHAEGMADETARTDGGGGRDLGAGQALRGQGQEPRAAPPVAKIQMAAHAIQQHRLEIRQKEPVHAPRQGASVIRRAQALEILADEGTRLRPVRGLGGCGHDQAVGTLRARRASITSR